MSDHTPTVAVRLQGGIGDHLLGMRVLRFVHARWPQHDIIVYSDGCGIVPPMLVAAMSPFVSAVVPVHRTTDPRFQEALGIGRLRQSDRDMMLSADRFIDAAGESMFAAAARTLDVPIFDIMSHRPELRIPDHAARHADRFSSAHDDAVFVGLHLAKYGPDTLRAHRAVLTRVLRRLLEDPRVVVLNLYATCYDTAAWPPDYRATRESRAREEMQVIESLCAIDARILPCADLPIATTAALVQRGRYFIGVDSGIKHLAWALGVPHTFFLTEKPTINQLLRWMPDIHRMLLFDSSNEELEAHLADARSALAMPCPSRA